MVEAQAFGTVLDFSKENQYPRVTRYAIQSSDDVERLEVVDPMEDRLWSVPLKAARIMNERVGQEIMIIGCLNSPFLVASEIWGYENLLVAQMTEPDLVEKLLGVIVESEKLFGEHLRDFCGVDTCFVDDATADADQNRPDLCRRFDLRFCGMITQHLHDLGIRTIIHNCSESPYLEEQYDQYHPDALHFNLNAVGLERAVERFKGKTCLIPGVDQNELLFKGRPQDIESEVRGVIDRFGMDGGLIMGSGCEMPFTTPLENVRALKNAVERYGMY